MPDDNKPITIEAFITMFDLDLLDVEHYLPFNDARNTNGVMTDLFIIAMKADTESSIKSRLACMDGNFFAESPLKMKLRKKSDLAHSGDRQQTHFTTGGSI
jgi:hypothetical protein